MAIVQQEFKRITQSNTGGKTAVAAAAYRNGETYLGVDGKKSDYINKTVDFHELIFPSYLDPLIVEELTEHELWLLADKAELNKAGEFKAISTSAYEYEFALPRELTPSQNIELAREFTRIWVDKHGCAANPAFHHLNGDNPHVHIMVTNRRMNASGELCEKLRGLDNKNSIKESRALFVDVMNKHLMMAGFEGNLSPLSYKAQGLNIEPVKHINHDKIAMNRRNGIAYEDMPEVIANREIMANRKKNAEPEPAVIHEPTYVERYKKSVPAEMTFKESIAQDFALIAHRRYIEDERKKLDAEKKALIEYHDKIQRAKTATVEKPKLFGLMKATEKKYSDEYIESHVKAYNTRLEAFKRNSNALGKVWNLAGYDVLKTHLNEFEQHYDEMRKYIRPSDYKKAYDNVVNQSVEHDNPYRQTIKNHIDTSISSSDLLKDRSTYSDDSFGM